MEPGGTIKHLSTLIQDDLKKESKTNKQDTTTPSRHMGHNSNDLLDNRLHQTLENFISHLNCCHPLFTVAPMHRYILGF